MLLFLACTPEPSFLEVVGTLFEGRDGAATGEGASVASYDYALEPVDSTTTAADGSFSVQAIAGSYLYLDTQVEGGPLTGFAGTTPNSGPFEVEDGVLYGRTAEEQEALLADFEGCEGLGEGATIDGEVRLYISGVAADEAPRVTTAWVLAYDSDGEETEACYLADTEDEVAYDAEAELTGYHGRFAVPDAPSGPVTLEVGYEVTDDMAYVIYYYLYVPEDGVAPVYPAWVEAI